MCIGLDIVGTGIIQARRSMYCTVFIPDMGICAVCSNIETKFCSLPKCTRACSSRSWLGLPRRPEPHFLYCFPQHLQRPAFHCVIQPHVDPCKYWLNALGSRRGQDLPLFSGTILNTIQRLICDFLFAVQEYTIMFFAVGTCLNMWGCLGPGIP